MRTRHSQIAQATGEGFLQGTERTLNALQNIKNVYTELGAYMTKGPDSEIPIVWPPPDLASGFVNSAEYPDSSSATEAGEFVDRVARSYTDETVQSWMEARDHEKLASPYLRAVARAGYAGTLLAGKKELIADRIHNWEELEVVQSIVGAQVLITRPLSLNPTFRRYEHNTLYRVRSARLETHGSKDRHYGRVDNNTFLRGVVTGVSLDDQGTITLEQSPRIHRRLDPRGITIPYEQVFEFGTAVVSQVFDYTTADSFGGFDEGRQPKFVAAVEIKRD